MYQFGWFSTGRGKGSRELFKVALDGINSGQIPNARISYVFCRAANRVNRRKPTSLSNS